MGLFNNIAIISLIYTNKELIVASLRITVEIVARMAIEGGINSAAYIGRRIIYGVEEKKTKTN
jgi:hypothetical protein